MELEAVSVFGGRFIVRPKGAAGTIGWSPFPWTAMMIDADSPEYAIKLAQPVFDKKEKAYAAMQAARSKG